MFNELDTVFLTHDIEEFNLYSGAIGTIVHVYDNEEFEVEFVNDDGETLALLTLSSNDIRGNVSTGGVISIGLRTRVIGLASLSAKTSIESYLIDDSLTDSVNTTSNTNESKSDLQRYDYSPI